jgi:hypothetical protein
MILILSLGTNNIRIIPRMGKNVMKESIGKFINAPTCIRLTKQFPFSVESENQ